MFDLDISTDELIEDLLKVTDEARVKLQSISQEDPKAAGGKNGDWHAARSVNGIWRQTGSAIDKARRKQSSHLKSQVGVAPSGEAVIRSSATESMKYGNEHEPDGFKGVVAWFKN